MSGIVTAAVVVAVGANVASNRASNTAKSAANSTKQTAADAQTLNIERWVEAQGYLDPFIDRSEEAAQQFQAEMGFTKYDESGKELTPRDMSEIPGYQAVMDESLSAVEQSAINSGSTAYGGRRIEAAGQVGANVQQSYYTNYMNMLQNLSSPTVATNLSSMGLNQGVTIGQQNIDATNAASNYDLQATASQNAALADAVGGITTAFGSYMNQPTDPTTPANTTNTAPNRSWI